MAARTRFLRARSLILSPSKKSIARHALPPRPALKSLSGSGRLAPWEKGTFTFSLWAFAAASFPLVGHTCRDYSAVGPPRASHPLPFLDYFSVDLKDALADTGERFATPVGES